MKIETTKNRTELTLRMEGSLDTVTAPDLEKELRDTWDGITGLVLDFADVNFISSAGLRVLLLAHKHFQGNGKMVLKNLSEDVREVFELTGLNSVLNFE